MNDRKKALVTGGATGIGRSAVLALAKAGSSMPARIAMIAMTTRSSMRVKAVRLERKKAGERGTAGDMVYGFHG